MNSHMELLVSSGLHVNTLPSNDIIIHFCHHSQTHTTWFVEMIPD